MQILFKNKHFRDNIVFVAVAILAFTAEPAIVEAQSNPYSPINFTKPLSLSRGNLSPGSRDSVYLSHKDSCTLVQAEWGWEPGGCDTIEHIVFDYRSGIDTLILEKPDREGYVNFDDWNQEDASAEIDAIWSDLALGLRQQSKALGQRIRPVKWIVYPTLNKKKSYMYYAYLMDWDGEPTINAKATVFDRQGHVPISIVPVKSDLTEAQLTRMVEATIKSYRPERNQAYVDFRDGDKIAAVGAMGVLASLVGVKYGKAVGSGFFAILLAFAKKAWFLILIPLAFLKNVIFGKKD